MVRCGWWGYILGILLSVGRSSRSGFLEKMSEMPAMIEARIKNLKIGLLLFVLMFLAFLLIVISKSLAWLVPFFIGVAIISFGSLYLRRASLVSNWNKSKGTVLGSSIGEVSVPMKYGGYIEYFPIVSFEYATTSGQFMSQRFTIIEKDFRHPQREKAEQLIQQYPQGASVEVYVNPSDRISCGSSGRIITPKTKSFPGLHCWRCACSHCINNVGFVYIARNTIGNRLLLRSALRALPIDCRGQPGG